MAVFNNTDDLVKHVISKTWNNGVSYTPKELGFPNNTPNASKKKTAANSLFAVRITDTDRREKYERGIGGAIVDKIIDDALKNGFTINIISTPEEPEKALTKTLTRVYKEKIELELGKALKWARLYGYNFLLMGRKDGQDLSTSLSNRSAKVEYIKAIPRNWITEIVYKKDEADYRVIPEEVEKVNLNPGIFGKNTAIHASRLMMIVNPGLEEDYITGSPNDTIGCSVLDRPFNVISVIDHMLWSAGQTMWRVGGGLLGLDLPPDATPEDRDAALDSLGDINAKTVLAFPDGYKANVLNTASAVLNPAPYFESAIVQLAGVTEYPKSILYGLATGAVTGSQLDRSTYYSKVVVKQNWISNFLVELLNKCRYVVKINNKRKLKYYLKDYDSGKSSQKSAAKALGITPRRFRQIHARCKIRIPHNTIHKVMLEFGFAKEQESKQKRRKPWIRYERKHSLSAVHIDWHLSKVNGKQLKEIVICIRLCP